MEAVWNIEVKRMDGWGSKESDIYGAISVVLLILTLVAAAAWIVFKGFFKVPMIVSAAPFAALAIFIAGIVFLIYTINLRSKGR